MIPAAVAPDEHPVCLHTHASALQPSWQMCSWKPAPCPRPQYPPTPLIPLTCSFLHSLVRHLFPASHTWLTQVDAQCYVMSGWMDGPIWKVVAANVDTPPLFVGLYQFHLPVSTSLYPKASSEASEGCPACEHPCPAPPTRVFHTTELTCCVTYLC